MFRCCWCCFFCWSYYLTFGSHTHKCSITKQIFTCKLHSINQLLSRYAPLCCCVVLLCCITIVCVLFWMLLDYDFVILTRLILILNIEFINKQKRSKTVQKVNKQEQQVVDNQFTESACARWHRKRPDTQTSSRGKHKSDCFQIDWV